MPKRDKKGQASAFKSVRILKIRNLQFFNCDIGIELESYSKLLQIRNAKI